MPVCREVRNLCRCTGGMPHSCKPLKLRAFAAARTCWPQEELSPHDNALRHAHDKGLIFKDRACRVRLTGPALLTPKKTPEVERPQGFFVRSLAVTYSGMPERHTTIGAERFHFRVRNGIGWFPLAMAARQTVKGS